jgi:hypothetical protein
LSILSFRFDQRKIPSILLAMQANPLGDWQRLTRLYSEKSDEELLELGEDFANLTDIAQQVLRDELRRRGLPLPQIADAKPQPDPRPAFRGWRNAGAEPNSACDQNNDDLDESEGDAGDLPHEYTWKTMLCTRDTPEEAWQISEVLRRAGIESWIEAPEQGSLDVTGPRVIVAADQLDEARAIASQPIPQDVIDQSKTPVEDFEPPSCPKCGAADPLLESVDPTNQWKCENCGARWSDSAALSHEIAP